MQMHVIASGLNLRAEAPQGDVLAVLRCGSPVTVTGPDLDGWVKLSCADPQDPSRTIHGVAAARFLRPVIVSAREALVEAAIVEWRRFKFGEGKEDVTPYRGYVGEMWKVIGYGDRDGASPWAWSAAAISWVVRKAAEKAPALDNFRYGQGHWMYIGQAIKRREAGEAGPYWGRRVEEAPVEIGDMVVQSRQGGSGFKCPSVTSYDEARECGGSFASHCDVIVGVSGGRAHALGGNVGNSFSMTSFDLDEDGRLKQSGRVYMVLQCQL